MKCALERLLLPVTLRLTGFEKSQEDQTKGENYAQIYALYKLKLVIKVLFSWQWRSLTFMVRNYIILRKASLSPRI